MYWRYVLDVSLRINMIIITIALIIAPEYLADFVTLIANYCVHPSLHRALLLGKIEAQFQRLPYFLFFRGPEIQWCVSEY